ncbi:MAG: hypothetical protein VKK59_05590 [Vampirovibrionales bacterium]|nr:hypothetical protein [Vampirovibrionales bacterium]
MRLAQKFSLSFASFAFIMVLFPALLKRQDPSKVVVIAVISALLSALVGYIMGNIFTHPKVLLKRSSTPKPAQEPQPPAPVALPSAPTGKAVSPRVIRSRAAAALAGTSAKSAPPSEPEEASTPSEEVSAPVAEASPEPSSEKSATSSVETPSNDPLS